MLRSSEAGRTVVELRQAGIGRFFVMAFLLVWLCGWAAGEAFAIGAILGILGVPLPWIGRLPSPPPPAIAVAMGAFLLLWLSFWTLGGLSAIHELLWLLAGSDRIEWDGAGIRHRRRSGPFVRTREIARETIRRLWLRRSFLVVETTRGVHALTRLGSLQERAGLQREIEEALGISSDSLPAELPKGWESDLSTDGARILRRSSSIRAGQSRTMNVIALLMIGTAIWVVRDALLTGHPRTVAPIVMVCVFASLATAGAIFLALHRDEILLRPGMAERRRRFGARESVTTYVPPSLRIEHTVDSDGDDWHALWLSGAERKTRLLQAMNDPFDVIQLGRWMAHHLGTGLELSADLRRAS